MNVIIPANSLDRHILPLAPALSEAANAVIRSGYFVLGPHVKAFERSFAAYCQVPHCIGVANGSDALELGLRAIGITAGCRVGVIANAAMYGTSAVLACDAEPVFLDIDPITHLVSAASLEAAASSTKLDAVIVTHLYGQLVPMGPIQALSEQHGFKIFEDCAQAHGAVDADGRKAGSFGAAASFSFYPTKNLGALGDGGAVTTSDDGIAERVRQLRQYGWTAKYRNELEGGRNSRLDELQAALLLVMLPHLDAWNARRREIIQRYASDLNHPDIRQPALPGLDHVGHLCVITTTRREELQQHLSSHGIGTDVHYPTPDHRQPILSARFNDITLPETEAACQQVLTLPCFPELTDAELDSVIHACNNW